MKKIMKFLTAIFAVFVLMVFFSSSVIVEGAQQGPQPKVIKVIPQKGKQGATLPITIKGRNFVSSGEGALSLTMGSGITVNDLIFKSSKKLTANISIAANAKKGPRLELCVINSFTY